MACLFLHNCVAYTLLFLLAVIVRCQTTTTLPGPPSYPDGIFTSPNTVETQILDKGMEMNVTWETTYANVNLYLIFGQGYANPRGLKISTTDTFYLWTVDDFGNNSLPFSFRAVNGAGTTAEQRRGGFYTGQFWIRDRSATTSTTSSSTSSTATTSSTITTSSEVTTSSIVTTSSTITTSSTVTTSSTIAESTSSAVSAAATSSAPKTNSVSTTSAPSESSTTSSPAATSQSSSSGQNHVGVGVGVGIGVGIAAILIGAFVVWRRHQKQSKQRKADEILAYRADSSVDQKSERSVQMDQRPQPSHLPSYELTDRPKRSPVEAYDRWQEPRELPASPFRR
ncbi:hypothetical protein D6D15_05174 [Aureobasidium pullulans]|uniref:Mid2 domain-containing protein n=1 Tax=Aureobasidium pullulans TaxID=5580 RepID=A0A4S9B9B2_AURPU|nr:hypothetical protein D6D15_05174 [Aureobasidium pullulans]